MLNCDVRFKVLALLMLICGKSLLLSAATAPSGLMCELLEMPERTEIRDSRPELGWIVTSDYKGDRQTAYRILARNSAGDIVWNTGKVQSPKSINVEYAGQELKPGTTYSWQVKVWTELAGESDWSEPQIFRTSENLEGYATSRYPLLASSVAPEKVLSKSSMKSMKSVCGYVSLWVCEDWYG